MYTANSGRYGAIEYRRCGRSGILLSSKFHQSVPTPPPKNSNSPELPRIAITSEGRARRAKKSRPRRQLWVCVARRQSPWERAESRSIDGPLLKLGQLGNTCCTIAAGVIMTSDFLDLIQKPVERRPLVAQIRAARVSKRCRDTSVTF